MPVRNAAGRVPKGGAPRKPKVKKITVRAEAGAPSKPVRGKTKVRPPSPQPAPTPKSSPAPKSQPGPYSDKQRKKVKRFKKTKQYKADKRAAKKAGKALLLKKLHAAEGTIERPKLLTMGPDDKGLLEDLKSLGADTGSAGLTLLEQTTRPVHAAANTSLDTLKEIKKGGLPNPPSMLKSAAEGFTGKKKTLYSDVLKEAGAPKGVQAVGGFALDVAADPLTYVSVGAGSVAKKLVAKEGQRVLAKAKAAGMSDDGARTVARRAEKRKADELKKKGKDNRGIQVGIGGAKTSGRATAAVSRALGVPKAAKRVRESKAVQTVGRNIRPSFRPKGADKEAFKTVRRAGTRQRAASQAGVRKVQARAVAYQKALSKKDYQRVIDAIESGKIGSLPDDLRKIAVQLRSDFRHMLRLERQRGIAGGEIRGRRKVTTKPAKGDETVWYHGTASSDLVGPLTSKGAWNDLGVYLTSDPKYAAKYAGGEAHHGPATGKVLKVGAVPAKKVLETRAGKSDPAALLEVALALDAKAAAAGIKSDTYRLTGWIAELRRGGSLSIEDAKNFDNQLKLTSQEVARAQGRPGTGNRMQPLKETLQDLGYDAIRKVDAGADALVVLNERLLRQVARPAAKRSDAGARGYFPHIPEHTIAPGVKAPARTSAANLASSKTRKVKKTLKTLRDEDPSMFSDDIPLVFGARGMASAKGVARADYLREVASTGRRLTPQTRIDTELEAAYKITPTSITKVEWKDGLKAVERGERGYVVLNKQVADDALKATSAKEGPAADLGRWYDRKAQGPVKTILTVPNPQYHFTNLYGDLFNAYLADTGLRSLAGSFRAQVRLARREAARKTLGKQLDPTSAGVKIGGRKVGYDDLIREAEEHGAVRSGFIGRDLPDVLDAQGKEFAERLGRGRIAGRSKTASKVARSRVGRVVAHPVDSIRNVSQYREDFVRLGTYIEGRKQGLSPAAAAERVAKHHFDYGDLTDFERNVLRRVFPFYTFTARNTPLQVEKFLSRPGKFSTYQKAREEFTKAAGLPEGWEDKLEDYEKRGLPLPLPLKDSLGNNLLMYPKLPLMDLGRLTVSPSEQARYLAAMVTPIFKSPFELVFDFNLFFGEKITNPDAPLVPAPDMVGEWPKSVRQKLGIAKFLDKRTGKKIWGWPAKVNYVARLTPMSATGLQMGTDVANDRGQDRWMKAFSYGTGLRINVFDETRSELNGAFDRRQEVAEEMAMLRQQDRSKRRGDYTKRYQRLLDETRELNTTIWKLKKKAGYKILPDSGAPKPSGINALIEDNLQSGTDVDALIDKHLKGSSDPDALIEKYLGN